MAAALLQVKLLYLLIQVRNVKEQLLNLLHSPGNENSDQDIPSTPENYISRHYTYKD